jgi:monoamine oxidase
MAVQGKGTSRRQFLRSIAMAGGATALWSTLDAWGMMIPTQREPPPLEGDPNDTSVVVLGAGLGGMAAAYELIQRGYDVQILEARDRPGGRNWTARRGVELTEYGGERQVCEFDEGLYYNPGPWRIPHHHLSVLHYARELDIPMEPFINYHESAYVFVEGDHGPLANQPIRVRQLRADMGGYTSELLARTAQNGELNGDLTDENVEQLVEYLRNWGLLDDDLRYTGSGRRGYVTPPGGHDQPGEEQEPYDLSEILPYAAEIMDAQTGYLASVASFNQQMTMFQPVDGMGRIGEIMAEAIGENRFTYEAEVQEIRQNEEGVRIVYRDLTNGNTQEITADYCICNIPLTILANIPSDFEPEMIEAIRMVTYQSTGKIGLQMSRRFWEEDDQIYGGVTRTNVSEIGGIAYPNYGFFNQKGVLQGYYNFGVDAIEMSRLTNEQRTERALEFGQRVHPQYRESFENAFSVAWHRVPYSLGGWATYTDYTRETAYPRLIEPDGRVYLVGDHNSYVTGWQAGAIESAWIQIEKLHERAMQTARLPRREGVSA